MIGDADSVNKRGNIIHQNYSQGILLEEGCAAVIVGNHLTKNIKANIALGINAINKIM